MAKKFSLFGFKIGKDDEETIIPSFAPPIIDDGALTVAAAANYGLSIDLETNYKSEVELITRYREMAMQPEIEAAIDDIVNETIIYNEHHTKPLDLNLDNLKVSTKIKNAIDEEFKNILTLLNFRNLGSDIFRRYYVDGRLYYNILVDQENPNKGIQELRYIDPRKLTKIREVQKEKDRTTGVEMILGVKEYYIYSDSASMKSITNQQVGLRIATDTIIDITSGLMDAKRSIVLSYLHKCITGDGRIKTPNGWEYLKDLNVGDTVYSYNISENKLEETKITNKWDNGFKDVVNIKSRHTSFKCTTDHKILVKDNKTGIIDYLDSTEIVPKRHQLIIPKYPITTKEIKFPKSNRIENLFITNPEIWVDLKYKNKTLLLKEIAQTTGTSFSKVNSFIHGYQSLNKELAVSILDLLPISLNTDTKYADYCVNELALPEFIDEDFAKLFGFLLGDGWVNSYTIGFAEGIEEDQNILYRDLLIKYFGNCSRIINKTRKSNYHSYCTNNTLGARLLKELGFISGSTKKRIPKWVYESKPNIQLAFIQGFCDADGCDRSKRSNGLWTYTITLANEQLILDLKELWTNLGFCSGHVYTFKQKPTVILGVPVKKLSGAWQITICKKVLPEYENIISINNTDEQETVFDIEVEHSEHNFIVNGSPVHNCIKPLNMLRQIEDASVIYKISRAPERRIFYVDVGNLPKMKAEQYLKDLMTKYKNKVVFDSNTGNVVDSRKYLSMQEDFWFPRRSDRSTEVTTLPSSGAFDDMSMVEYFEKKLYKALNVPFSRLMQPETPFSVGRSSEISRDEIKFAKFVNRLRLKFVDLFDQALRVQCVLTGICTSDEFDEYKQDFIYDWLEDNNYAELKDAELISNRVNLLQSVDPFLGKYYSKNWIQTNILNMNEDEIKEINEEIQEDIDNQVYPDPRLMNDPSLMGQDIPQDGYNDVASNGMQDSFPPAKQSNNIQPENPYYDQK